MITFFTQTNYTFQDIQSLIDNEVEESLHLEFKSSGALDKTDSKKLDISKDVAAFANADGGAIIYGLTEENHKANNIDYIDGNIYSKEWLENVISSGIQRSIPGLLIFPIRHQGDISKSIYIVKIPTSPEAPHLSKDYRFYKRHNFKSAPMEEYEIRALYARKTRSELSIERYSIRVSEDDAENDKYIQFVIEVDVSNKGNIAECDYSANVCVKPFSSDIELVWDERDVHIDYTTDSSEEVNKVNVTGFSKRVLFPGEVATILRFRIEVARKRAFKILKSMTFSVQLRYANGMDNYELNPEEYAEYIKEIKNDFRGM